MTKDRALQEAEQSIKDLMYVLAEGRMEGDDYMPEELEAFSVLDAIEAALALTSTQCEEQPVQEPVAVKHMLQWIERLKSLSNHGQYLNISGLGAGACWELANELEQFIKTAAQPDYRAVKTYHEGKPVYVSQPAQKPNKISTEELIYMTGVYDGKVLEREACAVLAQQTICDTHIPTGINIYGTRAAKAIRARGNT